MTSTIVPLENRASGEASQTTAAATSSARATRPNGDWPRIASPDGPSSTSRGRSVCTKPGATQVTETPCGASTTAIDWANALSPALAAA